MTRALRFGAASFVFLIANAMTSDAKACGGCFHPEDPPPDETSVVLGHTMALSISPDASVLWDQVEYTGSPSEFAWVLPVKPGARLEIASDAWFEALDAATRVRVRAPTIQCVTTTIQDGYYVDEYPDYRHQGCQIGPVGAAAGCSAEEAGAPTPVYVEGGEVTEISDLRPAEEPVSVVHKGSAGPYETVTLHANIEGALTQWLKDNGYAIDSEIQPIIDAYAAEGFDFIALRLKPDKGVQQMKPVRVVQPGAVTTLPLRMVAAGTGANVSLTLFVIAEGAYHSANFLNVDRPGQIIWDFSSQSSSYSEDRMSALAGTSAWMTAYAMPGALLSPAFDPATGSRVQYTTGLGSADTIADAYMDQAFANGEADLTCSGIFDGLAASLDKVVDPCPPEGGECAEIGPNEIDARFLACGPIEDLKVAMTGLHPGNVWVTRLESELPREALAKDLELEPSLQWTVNNIIVAQDFYNPPCEVASGALVIGAPSSSQRGGGAPRNVFLLGSGAIALWMMARRIQRLRRMKPALT